MDSVLGVTEKYQYIYYGHRTRSPHRYRVVELNLQQSEPTISLNAFLKYCHINTVSLLTTTVVIRINISTPARYRS